MLTSLCSEVLDHWRLQLLQNFYMNVKHSHYKEGSQIITEKQKVFPRTKRGIPGKIGITKCLQRQTG